MEGWELGLIIGCSVLAAILLAIIIRFVCKGNRDKNGESKPLLDGKTNTTAGLRFDKHIGGGDNTNNNNDRNNNNNNNAGTAAAGDGGFLDAQATKRINAWVDEVEKCRRGEGLAPLTIAAGSSIGSDQSQLLGDTPDLAGVVTPRTPTTLSPRISGVDPSDGVGGQSSTQGVYLGYSPKIVNS